MAKPLNTALLSAIAAGTVTHVPNNADTVALVKAGHIEVNPEMLDGNGNAAVRLTESGKALAGAGAAETETKADAPVFTIATGIALPPIKRNNARESKYPLKDIPEGGVIFIAAPAGAKLENLTKSFGSTVSDFNRNNTDRYLTTRSIADGYEAGFRPEDNPEKFKGVAGIGIWRLPADARPAKKEAGNAGA